MHFDLSQLLSLISSIPPDAVLTLLGGATGIGTVQQALKAKIETDTRKLSDGTNILITVALISLATAFAQFDGLVAASPEAFGTTFAALYVPTHIIFKVGINRFTKWFGKLLSDARELRKQKAALQAATPPAEDAIG